MLTKVYNLCYNTFVVKSWLLLEKSSESLKCSIIWPVNCVEYFSFYYIKFILKSVIHIIFERLFSFKAINSFKKN